MEIDHVFASGAVVGRATTHSWGRPAPRCARSDGRPHSCVVARPTTAPDAKTWSIPTTTRFELWSSLGLSWQSGVMSFSTSSSLLVLGVTWGENSSPSALPLLTSRSRCTCQGHRTICPLNCLTTQSAPYKQGIMDNNQEMFQYKDSLSRYRDSHDTGWEYINLTNPTMQLSHFPECTIL